MDKTPAPINIRTVANGYIMELRDDTLVFHSGEELTKWFMEVYPVAPPAPAVFDVVLTGCNPEKLITLIKCVRNLTGWGLKEAKDAVDWVRIAGNETVIHRRVGQEMANEIANQLKEAFGIAKIVPV